MLTVADFNKRCDRLFDNMRGRFKATYWKSGKRSGRLRRPARPLPFDRYDLRKFMAKKIGLNAMPCPYCGRPIDILSLHLDHIVPVSRGGELSLDNLDPACDTCNREKGELTAEEFLALRGFLRTLSPAAQADVQKRLRGSSRFMPRYEKKSDAVPAAKYRAPQMELDQAIF